MKAKLIVVAGPLTGEVFPLTDDLSIGRDAGNTVVISDRALSRQHCRVIKVGGHFKVTDLGSRNGTFINGVQVAEHQLRDADEICAGNSVFVFRIEAADQKASGAFVQLVETAPVTDTTVMLRPDDAVYLNPGKLPGQPAEFGRMTRDLNVLLTAATRVAGIRDRDSLAWQLLGLSFDAIPAQRSAVLAPGDADDDFTSLAAWDRESGPGHPMQVSTSVVRRVVREGVAVLFKDLGSAGMADVSKSVISAGLRSIICVPMTASGKTLGALYFDTRGPELFDENHLQVATAIAGIAGLAFDNVQHIRTLREENQRLSAELNLEHNMVGQGRRMRDIFRFIQRVALGDSTVLLLGESGTGKELVARAVHRSSPRAGGPFVAINCAAVTETLLESELFGHEKGAFTGAVAMKKGKVEIAGGGTLFLDEIGELAPALQAKLLRILQEREFERVGGTRTIKTDFRLIAATNRDLEAAIKTGSFRSDLYYRLNVVSVTLPPLRERGEDIALLAEYFLCKAASRCKIPNRPLSPEARACLLAYSWPGNVRELENAMERALVLGSGESILPEDLPESILESGYSRQASGPGYHSAIEELKKRLIVDALERSKGNYTEAAKSLGIHPNYLHRLIRNLELRATLNSLS